MNERIIKTATFAWIGICVLAGASILGTGYASRQTQNTNTATNENTKSSSKSANRNANQTAGNVPSPTLAGSDKDFAMKAATANMEEVEMGRVAAQKASSDAIRQFGQKMVDDHTKANQELMQIATSKGLALPGALNADSQTKLTKMQALAGGEFDSRYVKDAGVKDHEKAVKLYQKESTDGKDPELKAYAAKTLPVVQEHLTMAQGLAGTTVTGVKNTNAGKPAGNTNMDNTNRTTTVNSNNTNNMNRR
jgi:putative membrane protein